MVQDTSLRHSGRDHEPCRHLDRHMNRSVSTPDISEEMRDIPEAGGGSVSLGSRVEEEISACSSRVAPHMIRVLSVIPGERHDRSSMVFARRQMAALEQRGVTVENFFLTSRTSLKALLAEAGRFRKVIRHFDPHLVHAHYGTVTAFFCALATTRPLIISYRGSDLNPTSDIGRVRSLSGRFLSQVAALRARQIICVSRELKDRLWLGSRSASIIFDGVDLSLFRPMAREEARRRLGWSQDTKLVFFNLGGRPAGKRLHLAEGAIAYARQTIPDLDLVPVSKVDPEKIPLYMNACDCLLLTSDWEGSPTVVKEALACNLPVVSVDVGDVKDLLGNVQPSWVGPADVESIGNALIEILQAESRSNGHMRADEMSERRTTSRVLALYQEVVGKK
ncbi:glycosyltransferase involved in cell wall biosynthesis [Microvirga subterranea]|uniref:Glycosyltransferase involved in cell wall biosynthesis n=2 Tax=Microvirga subterranea TaxID=186651 RepID=A0A370HL53_9HYPH|nr:glycosyltransferase involved in cell wall biosynthesis [Microvirga subterranea]